jgi:hypothetical protein
VQGVIGLAAAVWIVHACCRPLDDSLAAFFKDADPLGLLFPVVGML